MEKFGFKSSFLYVPYPYNKAGQLQVKNFNTSLTAGKCHHSLLLIEVDCQLKCIGSNPTICLCVP